ncbi:MAG: ABC transporter, ATP-binding protein (cluster 3, basic aa/glutamine/opines), partial [uncultured Thermomicrobiales bacterium]
DQPSERRASRPPVRREQVVRRTARPAGHRSGDRPRRGRRRHRSLGLGQVDPVPCHQPARAHRQGRDHHRRRATARGGQGVGPAAGRRRHGVPELQPLRPQDRARERRARAGQGAQEVQGRRGEAGPRAPGARGRDEPGRQVPGAALRRSAAARGHRPRPGHGAQGDALRRAHLRAGPRDDQRGPRRHGGPREGRHDHGRRHPRDGLRPPGGQPRRLHGRRPRRRGRRTGNLLHQPGVRPGQGLPLQDPHPL